jgi:ATP phosphoribosyltransferase regulatory subunit
MWYSSLIMFNLMEILRYEEQITVRLRALYKEFGYSQYIMSRFEEYELYAGNKAFMPSGEILTFTDVGGKLMALRPDVTLSIVKYSKDDDELKKLYYNETVYRSDGVEFKEQMQVGLECLGKIDVNLMGEVLLLASRSLDVLGSCSRLDVSHMGFLNGFLQSEVMTSAQRNDMVSCIGKKNVSEIRCLCTEYGLSEEYCRKAVKLSTLYGPYEEIIGELRKISINNEMNTALCELEALYNVMCELGVEKSFNVDFSIVNDISYYSGIIFQGYVKGISTQVLSGGRYDELLRRFDKKSDAIGFAVYINNLESSDSRESHNEVEMLNVALPKGRLGEKAYALFEKAGFECPQIHEESRKLVFENPEAGIRYFWVKPSDVARYVERGAADVGVVGKDILMEYSPEVYELLDLGIGACGISVAAEVGFLPDSSEKILRVATKFPNIARNHYQKQGREIDIIELNGSIELAPLLGLSDVIVDIIETGQTLLENKLKPVETVADISARLIANKASYKFNYDKICELCEEIEKGVFIK